MPRRLTIVALVPLFILSFGAAASAKKPAAKPKEAPPVEATTPPVEPPAPPAEAESAPAEAEVEVAPGAEAAAEEAPAMMTPVIQPHWGGAFRARWVSLPHWFFGMFTKASQPVSSYSIGLEGFRRKCITEYRDMCWEISLGLGYQNMSAPDGNWLGIGHDAKIDTDWVQFKNFAFWTIDLAFILRQYFNEVFGIHYGAGLGLAIIQGDILRTSSSSACTDANVGDPSKCRPVVCTSKASGCTETELANSSKNNPSPDSAGNPNRFREGSVPGALPIINLLAGFDFRIPQAKGLEFRIDLGFYDAFFLGGAAGYIY